MKVTSVSCSIILVGTELTEGKIRDINGHFVASELKRRGVHVREIVSVPDDTDTITDALRRVSVRDDMVIVSGGLGPTSDDITRDAVAAAAGVELRENEACVLHIRSRVRGAWKANLRQALIPEGFSIIENPNGTACGFWGKKEALVVCLPGPPRELGPMFLGPVVQLIGRWFEPESAPELSCSLFLVSESLLEDGLQAIDVPSLSWSTRVEEHRIVVTLRGKSRGDVGLAYRELEKAFGKERVHPGETEAALLLSEALRKLGKTVACAESCTGGLVSRLLTDEPGASDIFWGAFVTYRSEAKERMIGVRPEAIQEFGVVSEAVVKQMCAGALENSTADLSLAVTGYAGPEVPEDGVPVGTVWVAAQMRGLPPQARCFSLRGGRNRIRRMSAVAVLLFGKSVLESGGRLDSNGNWGYI